MRSLWMVVVAALGCGGEKKPPSAEELHQQLAPIVEPKLVVIEKILKEPFPAPTGTLKVDGPPIQMIHDIGEAKVAGNALYAWEADLRSIEHYPHNPLRYNFNGEFVNDCFMMVRKKMLAGGTVSAARPPMPWTGDEHIVRMKLPHCAALRYLLVIKLDAFKDTKYIDKESFGGGSADAQLHVFDLEAGGKHLGGVTFAAGSSSFVRGGDIDADLRTNFYKSLKEAVAKHLPDANLGA